MRSFIFALLVSVGSIAAAQPVIENVPGVSDPVKVKVVSSTNGRGNAYLYIQKKVENGNIVHFASYRIIELVEYGGVPSLFAYNLYSKNGTLMATHSISKAVYLRLTSIFKQAEKDFNSYGNTTFYDDKCLISIEIDRATLALTKVTPSCDDLE